MSTKRVEAFSDGVLAIIITIMVLNLKIPDGHTLSALTSDAAAGLLTYVVSFVYVGIYWTNHHHLFHVVERISGGILWANLHLLFWLSLFPFTTAWMAHTHVALTPFVTYGINLLVAAIAYFILQAVIIRSQGADSALRRAIGNDTKGKLSPVLYITGIACALAGGSSTKAWTYVGMGVFVAVAVMWLIPDRRIERSIAVRGGQEEARSEARGGAPEKTA